MQLSHLILAVSIALSPMAGRATDTGAQAVRVTKSSDGQFSIVSPNYRARVGADGHLHSLTTGDTEFLLYGQRGLVGAGFQTIKEGDDWVATPLKFTDVKLEDGQRIVATADRRKLVYHALPDALELEIHNPLEAVLWTVAIHPGVTDLWETSSGERVPAKIPYRDGALRLFAKSGANVNLPAGSFFYVGRNSRVKPDTDPIVHQLWIYRTGPSTPVRHRLVIHAQPTVADALQASAFAGAANHIQAKAGPMETGLDLRLRFPALTVAGQSELVIREAITGKEVRRQSQPVRLAELAQGRVAFKVDLPAGVYEADLALKQGAEVLVTRTLPLVNRLAEVPAPVRPDDFDQFWDATLQEQERIPPNVQLTLHRDEPTHQLFKLRFDGLLGRQFHGWLSVPKTPGKHLAQLTLPPSGINPPYLPASGPNVVGMSLAIAGQEALPPEGGYQQWDYWRSGIATRETWYYRSVFAACSRAVDILAARPETDPRKIFVNGGSQGGGLSFITAALNPKVSMAVCGSPGLFGLEWKLRHLGPRWWPPIDVQDERGQALANPPAEALDARVQVARYGDAANFASRIRCPVLLNVGLQDRVTSPAAVLGSWSRLTQTPLKALLADPWGGHNGPRGGQRLMSNWLLALSAGGDLSSLATLTEIEGLPILVESKPTR